MKALLLDTNTLSFALKGHEAVLARLEDAGEQGRGFLLAPVAHFELTRYLDLKGASRCQKCPGRASGGVRGIGQHLC